MLIDTQAASVKRRTLLRGSVIAGIPLMGGCIGFLAGAEPLEFSATRATVAPQALDETGYSKNSVESDTITRTVSAAGQAREVRVTNWIAEYGRTVDLGPVGEQDLGIFAVVATPKVEVLGRTFNPVADMSTRELLQQIQSEYQKLEIGERVGSRDTTVLGDDVAVDRFKGAATFEDLEVELFIRVTTVDHGDDFVIPIGIYPQRLPDEDDRVFRLLDGIQH